MKPSKFKVYIDGFNGIDADKPLLLWHTTYLDIRLFRLMLNIYYGKKVLIAYLTNVRNKSYRIRLIIGRTYVLNPDSMLGILISNHNHSCYIEKKSSNPLLCIFMLS